MNHTVKHRIAHVHDLGQKLHTDLIQGGTHLLPNGSKIVLQPIRGAKKVECFIATVYGYTTREYYRDLNMLQRIGFVPVQ